MVSAASWGCHGVLLASRPGANRLPQFLFFTGMAASVLAALTVHWCEPAPPWVAILAVFFLGVAVRFLPHGRHVPPLEPEWQNVADQSDAPVRRESGTAVFEKDKRIKPDPK